jgi:CubicO group peptidase (beta-lactamase class C family)
MPAITPTMTLKITSSAQTAIQNEFSRQINAGLHSSASLAVFKNGVLVIDIVQGAPHSSPLFRVFSMGKPLAAAVLWRYKARGKFDWDTPVAEFWPEFGTREKSSVTIGHVLSHSAGLASSDTIPHDDYGDWGRVISHIEDMRPTTTPGSTVHYHSRTFGWLVAEITSRISALTFAEAFAREVTLPLGLKNTSFTVDQADFGRVVPIDASSEWPDSSTVNDLNSLLRAQIMMPAGSMITTAHDVAKFYSAISGKGKLSGVPWLPQEVVNEVTSLQAEGPDAVSGNYSRLGFGVRLPSSPPNQYASINESDTVGHGGMATCTGWASLDNDLSVAFITNRLQIEAPNKIRLHDMSKVIRESTSAADFTQIAPVVAINSKEPAIVNASNQERVWPGKEWQTAEPEQLGFDRVKLSEAGRYQAEIAVDQPYRILIIRHGKIAAEWNFRSDPTGQAHQASASKSTFSSILGIAISEGVIKSENDRVADYYPEMLNVAPGEGPKEGRYAFHDNAGITFKQLIGNTSGYMKPGEAPGKVFNYQTFGMNILTHAIASAYSLYKSSKPEQGAGFGTLTEWKIRNLIDGSWAWKYSNLEMHSEAKLGVFGYMTSYQMSSRDMARMGWLWLNKGNWNGSQIIPSEWIDKATKVSSEILENESEERHVYGLGFWCNDQGQVWPNLPKDSFAASGAGNQHIWVCPSLDLVIVQSPGIYPSRGAFDSEEQLEDRRSMQGLLGRIVHSIK